MAWYHPLRTAFDALVRRGREERQMDDEMAFHLEMEARRLMREKGLSEDEARYAAKRAFGGVEHHKDAVRDERGTSWIEDLAQDARFGFRTLRRRPGFTTVAALTLALGIGASTTLFGVVKAVLLTPLPYGRPEGIAVLWSSWKGFPQTWLSYDEYEGWKTDIAAFSNVGIFSDGAINLTENGESERLRAGFIDRDILPILGVQPALGRGFSAEEDKPNGPNVIILGHDVWQRRYGADPSIVGRSIQVNGRASVVVGVMPAGFKLPLDFGATGPTMVWLPLGADAESNGAIPGPQFQQGGGNHGFYGLARLRAGATIAQANKQLTNKVAQLGEAIYPKEQQFRAFSLGVEEQVTGRLRPVLLVVFAAVGFVLLIACANVAGLLLVRGEQRRREIALRVALGAGGQRISRQLLTETVVLASLGGALGVALAGVGVWLVRKAAPAALPRVAETRLDPWVLGFALGVAVLAALIAGLLPAMQATSVAPQTELRDGGRTATAGHARLRWRQTLVAAEVALAVVLVVGAGLMIRSVVNLFAIDAGIRPDGVLTMRLSTPAAWYPDSVRVAAFHDELRRRVSTLPGVKAVGLARILPLASEMGDWGLRVEGYTPPPNQGTPGDWQIVTPGYFEAMGLRLVQGRFFDDRDVMTAPPAMVVNRRFVELYLRGRPALGTHVRIGGQDAKDAPYTIVGVVDNVKHNGLTREVKAQFYVPQPQFATSPGNTSRTMTLVVRGDRDPKQLIGPVRSVIKGLDPRLPISEVRTMNEVVQLAIAAPRFAMQLLGLFGVLALVLSAIGIFGIVSQVVASRTQEFGIRAALGATPRNLLMLSLGSGMRQAGVGLVVGVAAALALTRTMTTMLEGVKPTDPATFVTVVGVTAIVAIGASLIPARRAAKTDLAKVMTG